MKTKQPKYTAGYRAVFRLIESFLDFMEKKDVSKAELARRTGVKRSSVTKWFSPGRNLTIFTAAMIAEALDAELRFLVVDRATEKPVVEFETQEPVSPARMPDLRVVEVPGATTMSEGETVFGRASFSIPRRLGRGIEKEASSLISAPIPVAH